MFNLIIQPNVHLDKLPACLKCQRLKKDEVWETVLIASRQPLFTFQRRVVATITILYTVQTIAIQFETVRDYENIAVFPLNQIKTNRYRHSPLFITETHLNGRFHEALNV